MSARLRVGVAVPAAGAGRRMGGVKKAWLELEGEPVLAHALRPFLRDERVVAIAVALAAEDAADPPAWIARSDERVRCVAGGATRAASVAAAVRALPDELDVILVHDAARPLVDAASIDRCVRAAAGGVGAVVGLPVVDTLKEVEETGAGPRIVGTPDRSRLWHAQTPQGFPAAWMRRAIERSDLFESATDDASLIAAIGGEVVMVEGDARNLKVTRPEDVPLATFHLLRRSGASEAS
ncbi:MAG: 2-C-methyl-D-erythritol 4-phosphate cytidylyltransferase [Longimicrobiales bacterium]|nr:2-C-methyl-D-erythritol 4-phosphate cytidylyltransferase [Longimicrobiales bacterium]